MPERTGRSAIRLDTAGAKKVRASFDQVKGHVPIEVKRSFWGAPFRDVVGFGSAMAETAGREAQWSSGRLGIDLREMR